MEIHAVYTKKNKEDLVMPYHGVMTKKEIGQLLNYLDYFQDSGSVFYIEKNGYRFESEEVRNFRKELDDVGFLLVFDWTQWISDHEEFKDTNNPIREKIAGADIETLRKLMTSYIRGDRFNEGLFIHVILKGHISNILLRLRELAEFMD